MYRLASNTELIGQSMSLESSSGHRRYTGHDVATRAAFARGQGGVEASLRSKLNEKVLTSLRTAKVPLDQPANRLPVVSRWPASSDCA